MMVRERKLLIYKFDLFFLSLDDRPDPLRIPEVILVICVLLLWCGSILIFIRHSQLLRIRHRDLPFRSSMKPPMNLNHITVVHRTSDMVIHSKPRNSSGVGYNPKITDYENLEPIPPRSIFLSRQRAQTHSFESNHSLSKSRHHGDQFLDPYMISSDVRRSLLDLHRKSMDNILATRHSISYSTNDISSEEKNDEEHVKADERCVQESPV